MLCLLVLPLIRASSSSRHALFSCGYYPTIPEATCFHLRVSILVSYACVPSALPLSSGYIIGAVAVLVWVLALLNASRSSTVATLTSTALRLGSLQVAACLAVYFFPLLVRQAALR